MLSRAAGEAGATIVLAATLLLALMARDEFPPPPTPTPPRFVVDVDGASIGSEVNDAGTFWTIDTPAAHIVVTNTSGTPRSTAVVFRVVDGPCAEGQALVLSGIADDRSVQIAPGGSVDVRIDAVEIAAFGQVVVEARPTLPACPPAGTDPRSIAFQLYGLDAIGS